MIRGYFAVTAFPHPALIHVSHSSMPLPLVAEMRII
jgi:hypothetical protein